jgi:protein-S-isoprenylcysteine O-methyltransferase Ste14
VLVSRLRRKLEADPRNPSLLLTVSGYGYCLAFPSRLALNSPNGSGKRCRMPLSTMPTPLRYLPGYLLGIGLLPVLRAYIRRFEERRLAADFEAYRAAVPMFFPLPRRRGRTEWKP